MAAYYNEIDPGAAAWLRELEAWGHIAPGDVDERSITEVQPDDIKGYTQHHFFAGIGGWSYAARLAGWPDDKPLWTGSPPCQPFSTAGKGLGQDDERHLAPHWLALVEAVRPPVIAGEQVASAIRFAWLDDLLDALENEGYSTGAAVLPACGVGAAHIRQRLWFVGRLGDGDDTRPQGRLGVSERADKFAAGTPGVVGRLADTASEGRDGRRIAATDEQSSEIKRPERLCDVASGQLAAGPVNGFWRDADWLFCRDGKWRPVESGAFPLAHGVPGRVGRLRGYGNAIVPQEGAEVIRCLMS